LTHLSGVNFLRSKQAYIRLFNTFDLLSGPPVPGVSQATGGSCNLHSFLDHVSPHRPTLPLRVAPDSDDDVYNTKLRTVTETQRIMIDI
jgi:hypothetical protein